MNAQPLRRDALTLRSRTLSTRPGRSIRHLKREICVNGDAEDRVFGRRSGVTTGEGATGDATSVASCRRRLVDERHSNAPMPIQHHAGITGVIRLFRGPDMDSTADIDSRSLGG